MSFRIGQGIDIHKFKQGRKLFLGGIEIPNHTGLDGHSDADVLIHSIIDALLGAAGIGDIGTHFPDSDNSWKDADSKKLLELTVSKLKALGFGIINTDSTVLTEEPKLKPYIPKIKECLASIMQIDNSACSVKAGTSEKLGFVGRSEGMMAFSVALIAKTS